MSRPAQQPQLDLQLPNLGALDRWHAEVKAGSRGTGFKDFDDLWAAACSEKAAQEAAADGDWDRAYRFLDCARLRLAGYRGDCDTKDARELLKQLKASPQVDAKKEAVAPAGSWKARPDPRGWR